MRSTSHSEASVLDVITSKRNSLQQAFIKFLGDGVEDDFEIDDSRVAIKKTKQGITVEPLDVHHEMTLKEFCDQFINRKK